MAIFSAVPPPPQLTTSSTTSHEQSSGGGVDIEAWTVTAALQSLSVSPLARGTGTPLSIPLDNAPDAGRARFNAEGAPLATLPSGETVLPPRRPRSARDSLRRREAIQKGKEGSRQRRRWENDRLVGVPNAQPPLPQDCLPRPTHPVTHVPYHVAHYWDKSVQKALEAKTARLQAARKQQQIRSGTATGLGVGEVPRDLREITKRSPVVKGWVRDLEEPVRRFLAQHYGLEASGSKAQAGDAAESDSSGDEEMLFAGRKEMRKNPEWRRARREVGRETVERGMMFQSFGDDEGASFKRWLTHSISDYYGLVSQSIVTGASAQKVVYVGVKKMGKQAPWSELPRPLWETC